LNGYNAEELMEECFDGVPCNFNLRKLTFIKNQEQEKRFDHFGNRRIEMATFVCTVPPY
jgi:hypothetical protein